MLRVADLEPNMPKSDYQVILNFPMVVAPNKPNHRYLQAPWYHQSLIDLVHTCVFNRPFTTPQPVSPLSAALLVSGVM